MSIMMWHFLYGARVTVDGYTAASMTKYLIITNLAAIIFTTAPIFRLSGQVRTGTLTNLLFRPTSVYTEGLATFLGGQIIYIMLMFALIIMQLPQLGLTTVFLLLVFVSACLLMFYTLTMVLGATSFWIVNIWPLRSAVNAAYLLLGGLYFPLSFLGKRYTLLLSLNPFSLVGDVPAQLVLGTTSTSIFVYLLAVAAWTFLLAGLYWVVMRNGLKRYEGVGV